MDPARTLFQPAPEPDEGTSGPFWLTTFGVTLPSGYWEPGEGYDCRPTDENSYSMVTDGGNRVAAFDLSGTITFGRTDSTLQDDSCTVIGVVAGDYVDDLGVSYTLTNGAVEAIYTPEEFFAGQDDGADTIKAAEPVG